MKQINQLLNMISRLLSKLGITTAASKLVSEVHDRMPVIIVPADYQLWLTASPAMAQKLLRPYASGLTLTPIGERVNSIGNDDVEVLVPISRS
jgi:putative SOS response-associated peptidase YedK